MKRNGKLFGPTLSLLAFTAVAVAWATFLLAKGGGLPDVGEETYQVSVVIPTGAALAPGSRVTMAGAEVGSVAEVKRRGMGARVLLDVTDDRVLPLAADTRVQVRQHTPVGENYIALVAGRSRERVESGGALLVEQSDEFVDVDRLLSTLKGETRERARMTIQGLGGALRGKGQEANDLLGGAGQFLEQPAPDLVDVLYKDRRQAARLVQQLGDVAAAIGQRDAAISTLAVKGQQSLAALRSRDDALRATLDELPGSLRRIRSTSDVVRRVSGVTKPVVDEATVALRTLRPTVQRLRPAAQAGRGVMRELNGAAPVLEDVLGDVEQVSKPLSAALPKLRRTMCETTPVLRYLKPYMPEALHILMGLGSASNSYDATGNLIRLAPIFGENSVSGLPTEVSKAASEVLYSGLLGKLNGGLDYEPYPAPGQLGRTGADDDNKPIGPEAVPDTGYKYPRVQADC